MGTSAIAELTRASRSLPRARPRRRRDRDAVVISWPSVPVEIIRAAGFGPSSLAAAPTPTPAADRVLEAGALPEPAAAARRGRTDGAARARRRASCCRARRTPTTSVSSICESSCAAASCRALPPVLLFDLLQSDGADVPRYDVGGHASCSTSARGDLAAACRQLTTCASDRALPTPRAPRRGGSMRCDGLRRASRASRPCRCSARSGSSSPSATSRSRRSGGRRIADASPLAGLRVHARRRARSIRMPLHAAIESQGAIVVAEIEPLGSGAAERRRRHRGRSNRRDRRALSDATRSSAHAGRGTRCAGPRSRSTGVDAVVVSLPPDDACSAGTIRALRELARRDARLPHACAPRRSGVEPLACGARAPRSAAPAAPAARLEARHG